MFRSRFLWRLYAGYVVLIVLTAGVIGVLIGQSVEQDTRDQIEGALRSRAVLLHDLSIPFVEGPVDQAFQDRVRRLGERTSTRFTVIRSDGVVIADSQEDPGAMDNHGRRPEVLASIAKGEGVATRYSRTIGEHFMYLALPVEVDGNVTGVVRASIPMTAVRTRVAQLRSVVVLVALGATLVALLIGLYVGRRVTRPLTEMTEVSGAISEGDYSRRINADRPDEVGLLAKALNAMSDRLREQIDTITGDRNKMAAILSGMVEGVVATDREERIVHINAAAERILGLSTEESSGKRIWEATRVREVSEALGEAMTARQVTIGEARIATPQQEQVVQLTATPLWGGGEDVLGAVVVLHDVSELRQLEMVRRDFIANISHELKTPLAAIRGLVETLIDDKEMEPATHERFLEKVRTQSARLTTLVNDLLTISRLESDDVTRDFQHLDLREPLTESLIALKQVAETEQVAIEHEIPDEPIEISGDAEALRELTDNLVGNAIKYTHSGGRVHVALSAEDGWAILEVEDDGIGIAPAVQGRVFERFYRVDKARSRELGGTGLGLSIVKHVALSHGGNVSLRSALGDGSTFRVAVPLFGRSGGKNDARVTD